MMYTIFPSFLLYICFVTVVWEQFEQLLGVDSVVGWQGRSTDVVEAHVAVVRAAEQPGRLRGVEDEAVNRNVLLVHRLPLVETHLYSNINEFKHD